MPVTAHDAAPARLNRPRAVVFDLDGTLYQDEVICYRLIGHLLKDGPYERLIEGLQRGMRGVLRGEMPLKLGHFAPYVAARASARAEELFLAPSVAALPLLNAGDYFDRTRYAYIGDGWSLAIYLARCTGLAAEELWRRFAAARQDLLSQEYGPAVHPMLLKTLWRMREAGALLMLCTGSAEADARKWLEKHGLGEPFHHIYFDVQKPAGFGRILEQVKETAPFLDEETLYIGDQGYRDLYDGQCRGAETVLISPFWVEDGMRWSARVNTMDELLLLLRQTFGLS